MSALWPDGCSFALALSHDVDRVAKRWQFPYYFGRAILRRQLGQLWRHTCSLGALLRGDDPYWNFERIMSLEDKLGVRSTFFFLDEPGRASLLCPKSLVLFGGRYLLDNRRIQQVICELDAGGWEIGLHGSYFSYRNEMMLKREKERLETILAKPVKGVRQHYLNLDIPETWHIQARVGLVYDSSLCFLDRIGFRWNAPRPFYPKDPLTGDKIPILELQTAIMDSALVRIDDPWHEVESLIDRVEREQGVLTVNWHQRSFNPWEYQERLDMYTRIIQECQRRRAWIVPLREVTTWWSGM